MVFSIILELLGFVYCGWLLAIAIKKHSLINIRANAYVQNVVDLGHVSGKKMYAITYNVDCDNPFQLLVTPCKRKYKVGKRRTIYFEENNAKYNHYFAPKMFNYDKRFTAPAIIGGMSLLAMINTILKFVN